jgi:hypothetical protein
MVLKRELDETLSDLVGSERSLTTDDVLRWKWETLQGYKSVSIKKYAKTPWTWTKEEREAEDSRVIAVSFAAAALCLFFDLDSSSLREGSAEDMRASILKLARVIRGLTERLDASTKELGELLVSRRPGRPKERLIEPYTALHLYRMGWQYRDLAEQVGIGPGSRNWKKRLMTKVGRGIDVEKEKFPRATKLFARQSEDSVRDAATKAYDEYRKGKSWRNLEPWIAQAKEGYDLLPDLVPDDPGTERRRAYIQLGCCLDSHRDPMPST